MRPRRGCRTIGCNHLRPPRRPARAGCFLRPNCRDDTMSDAHRSVLATAGPATFDAISLQILWGRLIAIVDEGATALLRTAFTTIMRESNDYAVVLMDLSGDTIAECSAGIPAFGGLLSVTTRAFIDQFPLEDWREGDVVM